MTSKSSTKVSASSTKVSTTRRSRSMVSYSSHLLSHAEQEHVIAGGQGLCGCSARVSRRARMSWATSVIGRPAL